METKDENENRKAKPKNERIRRRAANWHTVASRTRCGRFRLPMIRRHRCTARPTVATGTRRRLPANGRRKRPTVARPEALPRSGGIDGTAATSGQRSPDRSRTACRFRPCNGLANRTARRKGDGSTERDGEAIRRDSRRFRRHGRGLDRTRPTVATIRRHRWHGTAARSPESGQKRAANSSLLRWMAARPYHWPTIARTRR